MGTLAPIWFWVTLTVLALLHNVIDVSGHQLLPYGLVVYIGFFSYGTLTLVFVWGLSRRLPAGRRATAATAALTLFGCGPLLCTFTMSAEPGVPGSWPSWLHAAGFLIVALMPIAALPLFGTAVWNDSRWRPLGPVSVVWGVVVAVIVFLPATPAEGYALWSGPGSYTDLALIGTWQIVVSRRLAQLAGEHSAESGTTNATATDNIRRQGL